MRASFYLKEEKCPAGRRGTFRGLRHIQYDTGRVERATASSRSASGKLHGMPAATRRPRSIRAVENQSSRLVFASRPEPASAAALIGSWRGGTDSRSPW